MSKFLEFSERELEQAEYFYKNKDVWNGIFHGKDHILAVLEYAERMVDLYGSNKVNLDTIAIAILLHDAGREHDSNDPHHALASGCIARDYLNDTDYDAIKICDIIAGHNTNITPRNIEESIVRDSDRLDIVRFNNAVIKSDLMSTNVWHTVLPYAMERRGRNAMG